MAREIPSAAARLVSAGDARVGSASADDGWGWSCPRLAVGPLRGEVRAMGAPGFGRFRAQVRCFHQRLDFSHEFHFLQARRRTGLGRGARPRRLRQHDRLDFRLDDHRRQHARTHRAAGPGPDHRPRPPLGLLGAVLFEARVPGRHADPGRPGAGDEHGQRNGPPAEARDRQRLGRSEGHARGV
ncbi:hypothetical protein VARIO8X_70115 [Burkholderiales bacterium 8X]|nr:hypothetical protein VARIO8X_70115 [Burkholderiales bacterium 8X]